MTLFLVSGCLPALTVPDRLDNPDGDFDADGLSENEGDCDDSDPTVSTHEWYADADRDGYGADPAWTDSGDTGAGQVVSTSACAQPDGFAPVMGDCDDRIPAMNPGADEQCGNGMDDDCDGVAICDVAADEAITLRGSAGQARAGQSLAAWDGGGGAETILVGEPGTDTVYILPVTDAATQAGIGETPWQLRPLEFGNEFGYSIAVLPGGADGVDGFLVGGPTRGSPAGGAWLFSAAGRGEIDYDAVADWTGQGFERAGNSVAALPGDGMIYPVVTAPGNGTLQASVYILELATGPDLPIADNCGSSIRVSAEGESITVAGIHESLVIGIPVSEEPRALVFGGPDLPHQGSLTEADAETVLTGTSGESFGRAIAGVGDLDGDGYEDLAVGAPNWNEDYPTLSFGRVYIYLGAAAGIVEADPAGTVTGLDGDSFLGTTVASAGKTVDGDTTFLVGTARPPCGRSTTNAAAWLVYGVPYGVVVAEPGDGTLVGFARDETDPCGHAGGGIAATAEEWVAVGHQAGGEDMQGSFMLFAGPWERP